MLRQTEAGGAARLAPGIMIRLKALTGGTWTDARRWEQFARPINGQPGRGKHAIGPPTGSREGLRGEVVSVCVCVPLLPPPPPKKAAGDSTVPVVRFHYIPSVSASATASNHVLSPGAPHAARKASTANTRWPFFFFSFSLRPFVLKKGGGEKKQTTETCRNQTLSGRKGESGRK